MRARRLGIHRVVLPAIAAALAGLGVSHATSAPSGVTAPRPKGQEVVCARYAAPTGSDSNRGTKRRPFRTAQRLADSLSAGQTGCLRGGTYLASGGPVLRVGRRGAPGAPLTIRSFPGERAKLVGIVRVVRGSDHVRLRALDIEGTGGEITLNVYAADVIVEYNNITNAWRGPSCMLLGDNSGWGQAVRPIVRRNRFHECGSRENDNKDHAIYAANVVGGQIVANVFWNTAAYALHLYPNAQRTRVARNIVDGDAPSVRGGVLFGGDSDHSSSNNVVEHNVIAYSQTHNIESWWESDEGSGNIARRNCLWGGKKGNVSDGDGFQAVGNTVARPVFLNRSKRDYRLRRGSRCHRILLYASRNR